MDTQIRKLVLKDINKILQPDIYDKDDIIQHVFVKILELENELGPDFFKKNRGFLYNRVKWTVTDYFRKSKNMEVATDSVLVDRPKHSVETKLTNKLNILRIKALLHTMDKQYSRAVHLYYFYDKSFKEIAKILGVSETTAYRIVKTGIAMLREKMKMYNPDL